MSGLHVRRELINTMHKKELWAEEQKRRASAPQHLINEAEVHLNSAAPMREKSRKSAGSPRGSPRLRGKSNPEEPFREKSRSESGCAASMQQESSPFVTGGA